MQRPLRPRSLAPTVEAEAVCHQPAGLGVRSPSLVSVCLSILDRSPTSVCLGEAVRRSMVVEARARDARAALVALAIARSRVLLPQDSLGPSATELERAGSSEVQRRRCAERPLHVSPSLPPQLELRHIAVVDRANWACGHAVPRTSRLAALVGRLQCGQSSVWNSHLASRSRRTADQQVRRTAADPLHFLLRWHMPPVDWAGAAGSTALEPHRDACVAEEVLGDTALEAAGREHQAEADWTTKILALARQVRSRSGEQRHRDAPRPPPAPLGPLPSPVPALARSAPLPVHTVPSSLPSPPPPLLPH
eukprot:scaffold72454_cov31-Tisochrysis_lutea.AAC.4